MVNIMYLRLQHLPMSYIDAHPTWTTFINRMSPILTSWDTSQIKKSLATRFDFSQDDDFYHEIRLKILLCKRRLHSLKKLATKEALISMKPIFNAPSKSTSFKEKITMHTFKKHDPLSCGSKGSFSHDKSHYFAFIQVTDHSSSLNSTAFFEMPHSFLSKLYTEEMHQGSDLHPKSTFQDANFMNLI